MNLNNITNYMYNIKNNNPDTMNQENRPFISMNPEG